MKQGASEGAAGWWQGRDLNSGLSVPGAQACFRCALQIPGWQKLHQIHPGYTGTVTSHGTWGWALLGPPRTASRCVKRVVRGVPTLLHGHCSVTHKICNLGICSLERRRQASDGAGWLQGSESLNPCLVLQGDSWYLHILFQRQVWAQQLGPWQGVCQVLPLPWQESQASQHRVPSPPSTHHACSVSSSKPAAFSLPQAGLVPKSPLTSWYKVAVYVLHFSNHLIKR